MIVTGNGQSLQELLARQGVQLEAPCGGKGICGKCRVRASGDVSAPDEREWECLTRRR
jgi:ferredoxin